MINKGVQINRQTDNLKPTVGELMINHISEVLGQINSLMNVIV